MKAWARFFLRAGIAVLLAALVFVAPLPLRFPQWIHLAKAGVTSFLLICYLGWLLYDTLFYDRYRP